MTVKNSTAARAPVAVKRITFTAKQTAIDLTIKERKKHAYQNSFGCQTPAQCRFPRSSGSTLTTDRNCIRLHNTLMERFKF